MFPAISRLPQPGWSRATIHPDAAVTLKSVGLNPTRTALIDVLREMGAGIDAIITGDARRRAGRRHNRPQRGRAECCLDRAGDGPGHRRRAAAARRGDGRRRRHERGARRRRVARQGIRSHRGHDRGAPSDWRGSGRAGGRLAHSPWPARHCPSRDAPRPPHRDGRGRGCLGRCGQDRSSSTIPTCVGISYPSFWRDAALLGAGA